MLALVVTRDRGGNHALVTGDIKVPNTLRTPEDDDQPKLRGSGVVVTLVFEYPRDPEGI